MTRTILVSCLGNMCRSPMAKVLLQDALEADCVHGAHLRSAGLAAQAGLGPAPLAEEVMREYGLDISDHLTCRVDEALVRWADLILVMENRHKAVFDSILAGSRGKVIRLGEFGNFDIPDPMGRDIAAFREVKHLIDRGVHDWVPKLKQWNLSENH